MHQTARLETMRHKTTQTVFDYFNRIRGGNAVPLRSDIDPSALKAVLPDIFILEIGRNGSLVFRLAGTRVCIIMGRELRGEDFRSLWHGSNEHKMRLAAETVSANQAPLTVTIHSLAEDEIDGDLEMLLMPLASRPGLRDRLFGTLVDLGQPPLIGERPRQLWGDHLNFVAPGRRPISAITPEAGRPVLSVVGSSNSTPGARPLHLRVLDGGRRD